MASSDTLREHVPEDLTLVFRVGVDWEGPNWHKIEQQPTIEIHA